MSGLERSRRAAGYNREQVGRLVFRNPETIARWERGVTSPSKAVMLHLANIYGCPVEALVDA